MTHPELEALHDIVLPAPVGLWPPAPGWWLLAGAALALVVLLLIRRQRRQSPPASDALDQASAALEQALRHWEDMGDGLAYLHRANRALKKAALVRWPRQEVAGLHGEAWRRFLLARGADPALAGPVGDWLTAHYGTQPPPADQLVHLHGLLQDWLQHCRQEQPC